MSYYHISANDLEEDEVNFELSIRGYPVDGLLETRLRTLRKLLREEEEPGLRTTIRSIEEELNLVPEKLRQIDDKLSSGVASGSWSRLVHLHKRIRRYSLDDPEQRERQQMLLDAITRMSMRYFGVDLDAIGKSVPFMRFVPLKVPEASGVDQPVASSQQVSEPEPEVPKLVVPEGSKSGVIPKLRTMNEDLIMFSPLPTDMGEERRHTNPAMGNKHVSFEDPFPLMRSSMPPILSSNVHHSQADENFVLGTPRYKSSVEFDRCRSSEVQTGQLNSGFRSMQRDNEDNQPSCGAVGGYVVPSQHKTKPEKPSITVQNQSSGWQQLPLARGSPDSITGENIRPSVSAFTPVVRQDSTGNMRNGNEFIRVSEIEQYIQNYLRQMAEKAPRSPAVSQAVVHNLVDRIADLGVSSAASPRMSRPDQPNRDSFVPRLSLEPPLQLRTEPERPSRMQIPLENNPVPIVPSMSHRPSRSTPILVDRSVPSPRMSHEQYRNRLPHHTCNIIEKWPKFSGDSNPVPVVDFLRQIEILSRSYQITAQELRIHAHLLFKDDAYVWFTAYDSKMDSWETLLTYLKMRYDNPNRDRFIREEMRNRKQRPNELFSAFLTDLEAMSQRMMRKMSDDEKFDIIVENMKLSYKRRLALEPVYSIEHLAQLCYKFDALEANLYNSRTTPKPNLLHQIEVEDELSEDQLDTDDLDLLAIQAKTDRKPPVKNNPPSKETVKEENLCWNCRKTGHMWRDCGQRKTIFCHICGNAETTAYQCPQKHNLRPRNQTDSKNE